MYISFKGIGSLFTSVIKLFIVGIIIIALFKVATIILPIVLVGFGTVYLINYYNKRKDDEVEIVD